MRGLIAENKTVYQISMEVAAILLFSLLFLHKSFATELDTISDSTFLTDGDTLVSATGVFELGFFRPGSSENRYLGIWYKKFAVRTVVWVANRDRPVRGASPLVLKIADQGILGLFTNISMVWSSNTTTSGNASAKLRVNGNLVVIDQNEKVLWQSFDYPTDTLLPGMKLGRDYLRGKEWHLSPWKSSDDPAPGGLTWGPDALGYPENKLRQGALVVFRGGPWSNERFPGISVYSKSLVFRYDVIINESEVSFAYNLEDNSILSRVTLNSSVHLESWAWVEEGKGWQSVVSFPRGACDQYNICSAYGTCSINMIQQSCTCLDEKRFVPKNQKEWDTANWSGGCIRRKQLECKNGSAGFVKYSNVKLPDAENTWFNMNMSLEECGTKCLNNCTCMAYANPEKSRSICLLWLSELLDIQVLPERSGGPDIFVRMASSELDSQSISRKQGGANVKIILLVVIPGVLLIALIFVTWLCCARRKRNHAKPKVEANKSQEEDMDLPLFSFSTISNVTANFSPDNKLGEGGFGPVYKWLHVPRVWKLYNEGSQMELIDASCAESCHPQEVIRSIKIGLLCVQQSAGDRLNMSSVIMMLGSEGELLEPKQPSFLTEKELPVVKYSSSTYTGDSVNEFTITEVDAL
ncbi:hypothetical protein L1987_85090 [Smallanthus sonchifolius]|uniref:Uncharacterized protein n=1 Tax=Smallanthus sonchifolius TaxID=185202 RepID=A0ACB8XZQ9_9ASTR|nr:hypothetical protein L1987_85090 [Smallanthus sonchifolius]